MSDEELDPEQVRDLAIRRDSMRDSTRQRGQGVYDWRQPELVGAWRCRVPSCRKLFGVTAESMEQLAQCNTWLRDRGEAPLEVHEVGYCDSCRAEFKLSAAGRRRGQVERMRVAIIEFKESKSGERQRELIDQLKAWGHPDVDGLVNWMRERNKTTTGKKRDL